MVSFGFTVNTENLPDAPSFEPIPAGNYQAMIESADIKDTSKGGQMLNLKWDILGPEYAGRKIFQGLNLRCPSSEKAEEIAAGQLGQIIAAIGLAGQDLDDTDALIGGNAEIRVIIKPAADGYDAKNEVKGVKSLEGSEAPAPGPKKPAKAPAKPEKAPWGARK